ncbi:hypothetical protein [Micromonospora sp. NBC_01813]|uniref:hypothetical protein n=1 Tax=Micromonospora sp. NBC_01813 TaxID=2975988 RepID=UPI002DD8AB75|nr:hypothetical protein [Micromonospora sp. NBC_01813]WSA12144.1 hypothetical protein OG958_15955 [Micromonospora sp. NBC_01813]
MRGDLDDALARLARRDQLNKRVSQGNDRTASAAQEIAAAVRQVVERHPGLTASVRLVDGGQAVDFTVAHHGGRVQVTVDGPTATGQPPATGRPPNGTRDVHGHPGGGAPASTGGFGESPTSGVPTAGGPPDWPPRSEFTPGSPAARLAEMIRQDPSLLNGTTES